MPHQQAGGVLSLTWRPADGVGSYLAVASPVLDTDNQLILRDSLVIPDDRMLYLVILHILCYVIIISLLLGHRLPTDDLVDWNSGVCVCVCPSVYVHTYIHRKFLRFRSHLVCG